MFINKHLMVFMVVKSPAKYAIEGLPLGISIHPRHCCLVVYLPCQPVPHRFMIPIVSETRHNTQARLLLQTQPYFSRPSLKFAKFKDKKENGYKQSELRQCVATAWY